MLSKRKMAVTLFILLFTFSSFAAAVRLVISKPNNFNYSEDKKTQWFAPVVEAYFDFKFSAFPTIDVISITDLKTKISGERDFSKRISKNTYITAAKKLNATHVLYLEYEAQSPKQAVIYATLKSLDGTVDTKKQETVLADDMNSSLSKMVKELATGLGIEESEIPTAFLSENITQSDTKLLKKLGDYLVSEDGTSGSDLRSLALKCEKLTDKNPSMAIALYPALRLYNEAGAVDEALRIVRQLTGSYGRNFPKLSLMLAKMYRKSGRLVEAKRTIDRLVSVPAVRVPATLEKALIYESLGQVSVAERLFNEVKNAEPDNPIIFIHLANIALMQKKGDALENYISEVARITGKSEADIYADMGESLFESKKYEAALTAYLKGVEKKPTDPSMMIKVGDVQLKLRLDSAAGASYLAAYAMDYIKYAEYLDKGAKLLERTNHVDIARKAYSDAFAKTSDPKVAVAWAKLESNSGNCAKVRELLTKLSSPWDQNSEVTGMLDGCSGDLNAPKMVLNGSDTMRVSAGDSYIEPGASASDAEDGDLTSKIVITGVPDTKKPGTYTVTYTVKDAGNNVATKYRTVIVTDNKPPKILVAGGENMRLALGTPFQDPGITVTDNVDGDITAMTTASGEVNTTVPGSYIITYRATDAAGNTATAKRSVIVFDPSKPIDSKPPVIHLIGGSPTTITEGENYEEPGVNAVDETDGDVTMNINIEGEVNSSVPGDYQIVYTVTDKTGNLARKVLKVKVLPKRVEVPKPSTIKTSLSASATSKPVAGKPSLAPVMSKKKSPRKPVLAGISGVFCIGAVVTGIIFDNKAVSYDKEASDLYDDVSNNGVDKISVADYSKIESKYNDSRKNAMLRNVMYGVGGVFGLTFVINLAIPSK